MDQEFVYEIDQERLSYMRDLIQSRAEYRALPSSQEAISKAEAKRQRKAEAKRQRKAAWE